MRIVASKKLFQLVLLIAVYVSTFENADAQRVGWWNFNNPNQLTEAVQGYGQDLVLTGSHTAVNGPAAGDFAGRIGVGSYYTLNHSIAPNGGGNLINEYSLQFDFRVASLNIWHSFFQTTTANNNDADFFINPSGQLGVAAVGYTTETININEWYRLVLSVDNGSSFRVYLDGDFIMQGNVQDIDGRFALANSLLLFADEDGEDNLIDISEVGLWDYSLGAAEVAALGGFSHQLPPSGQLIAHPFLQSLTPASVYVCWHDTDASTTKVAYGTDTSLGMEASGSSETVSGNYRWHSVKLTGLEPNTKYYYKLVSGNATSSIYSFRTMPGDGFAGHLRFLLFSDTQDDSATTGMVVRAARDKMSEIFGSHYKDSVQLIMHTGDIVGSGSTISQWTDQFFRPFAPLTDGLPFMSVAGNHELEHLNYYKYIKYDDFSAFGSSHPLHEKIWSYHLPGTLFIGLNTNVINNYGQLQRDWLDSRLAEAEQDPSIHFVFCFLHHPPKTELWNEGNTPYVEDMILPILKKYSKVQQLSYGHTHAYERGVVNSNLDQGDFRISCVGGGGGNRDRWGEYSNTDYPEIHIALDHHFYVFYDIDLANLSYEGRMYDLGNSNLLATNQVADAWHRRLNQLPPAKPIMIETANESDMRLRLTASAFSGLDEVMSAQFQLSNQSGQYEAPLFDNTSHWQNLYGVTNNFQPIDWQHDVDLRYGFVPHGLLANNSTYYVRMRYRDQNLRWSAWSDELSFVYLDPQALDQIAADAAWLSVSPNPASDHATIQLRLNQPQVVSISLIDSRGRLIRMLAQELPVAESISAEADVADLEPGLYFVIIQTEKGNMVRKLQITH